MARMNTQEYITEQDYQDRMREQIDAIIRSKLPASKAAQEIETLTLDEILARR